MSDPIEAAPAPRITPLSFRTARGVVYRLEDDPPMWRRMANPGPREAGFPPDQHAGRLLGHEIEIGRPAVLVVPSRPFSDELPHRRLVTDSPVSEVW